ncbi:uncharacterized protein LOC118411245 isoform X1 [Branchiostoma floridae]|uniref:Uncharacterized protein LOC118411245 isoform X1 n=1 Tax=Branchiostoma floridae TaxID=7739 RepID=A0A9J7MJ21_BRAFL|nr:uncharacterized protein LOC118411245 isoform X1 [Branchiostoma floridae]
MGRSDYCCVLGCRNKRAQATAVTLYRFPDNPPSRKKLWMENVAVARGQPDWTPKNSTRICAAHFVGGRKSNKPDDPNYVPTLFGVNVATPIGSARKNKAGVCLSGISAKRGRGRPKKIRSEDPEWTPQGKQETYEQPLPHWEDETGLGTDKWAMVKKEEPFFAESLPTMVPLSRPGCSSSFSDSASPRYEPSMHSPVGLVTDFSSFPQDAVEDNGSLLDITASNGLDAATSPAAFGDDFSLVSCSRDSSHLKISNVESLRTDEEMVDYGGTSHTQSELNSHRAARIHGGKSGQEDPYEHDGQQTANIMLDEHTATVANHSDHKMVEKGSGEGVTGLMLVNKGSRNDPVFVVMPTAAEQSELSPQQTRMSSRKRKVPQKYDPSEFDTEEVWQEVGDTVMSPGVQEEEDGVGEANKRLRRLVSEQRDVHLSELLQLHEENKYLQEEVMQVKQMQDFREENKRLKKLVGQQRDVHLLELQQLKEELQQIKQAWQAEVREKNEIIKKLKTAAFCLDLIKDDDSLFNFYTGFQNYNIFKALADHLRPHSSSIYRQADNKHSPPRPCRSRSLSFDEELFMVCVRLKAGLLTQDISHRFNISAGTCSRIFRHWLPFLKEQLQGLYGTETPSLHSVQAMKTKVYHIFDGGLPQMLDDMEETLHVVCAFLSSFDTSLVHHHNVADNTAASDDSPTLSALLVT